MSIRQTMLLLVAVLCSVLLYSCADKEDEPAPSPQDLTIEALRTSNFMYDPAQSSTSASGIDISDISIALSQVNETATFSFTLSGGIDQVVSGGLLEINDTGSVQISTLSASSFSNLNVAPGSSTSFQDGVLTLELETSVTSGRTQGLGSFILVFTTDS